MALLTDQTLATGVTLNDLIHIVIPTDISQNPAGSSYKANIGQVGDVFSSLFVNQSGDTMTGPLIVPSISATTYQNLPQDVNVTGFTYDNANTLTIYESDGGTYSTNISVFTGITAATLNISSTPTTDTNLPVEYLTRDSATGEVKIIQIPGPTVYGLFAQTGNSVVVSATTVESTIIDGGIGSLNVPANGFSIGDSFRADFGGLLSSKNNDTITIRVKSGSVVLADSGAQTLQASTDDVWQFSVNFTVRQVGTAGVASIVTLGVFHTTKQSNGTQTGFAFNFINNTTFDTTTPNTLDVTAQFSSNSPLNSIYSDIFVLNKIF